jgi:hypothetical protein
MLQRLIFFTFFTAMILSTQIRCGGNGEYSDSALDKRYKLALDKCRLNLRK